MKSLTTVGLETDQNCVTSHFFPLPLNTYLYNPNSTVISVRNSNMTAEIVGNISLSTSHFCVRKREEV